MLTTDARYKNVPPPLDLPRILKSYHNVIPIIPSENFLAENRTHAENFFVDMQRGGEQAGGFLSFLFILF